MPCASSLPSAESAIALLRGQHGAFVEVAGDVIARAAIIAGALLVAKVPPKTAAAHALIASLAIELFVFLHVAQNGEA